MYNLIRKDFVIQRKTLALMMIGIAIYLFLDISSMWVGVVFGIVIVVNTFALEEKASVHKFINSMPYTRREVVQSRYVVVLLFTLLVATVIFMGNLVIHRELIDWKDMLIMCSMVILAASFIMPFCYKFKSNYLLISSVIAFASYFVVVTLFVPNLNDYIRELMNVILSSDRFFIYLFLAVVVSFIYGLSGVLSTRIYHKKIF
ncbi:ABC transporter permease [Pontibacillus halophilus JSM 076056 = DSM 19796]|uniref:ABC transporter permease n=1 Tax=Pontibacillus halophilus JSM 076056 = DSM 19796 TaxID=1385510 RepID=A0A0A5GD06_9BACI|nr:ABC-2 transporter permease [Pontibacillus halophilus]KGX91091.1 ABC transporter permease [Pontibacillus halophilus JSM 076056 = DSM 19796]